MDCIFCKLKDYVAENDFAYAVYDLMPVNEGHMLIIAKRHVQNFFDLTVEEQNGMIALMNECKKIVDAKYHPDGYNFGANICECAGQSVMHVHIHLIPRFKGDTKYAAEGVRSVIPEKMQALN